MQNLTRQRMRSNRGRRRRERLQHPDFWHTCQWIILMKLKYKKKYRSTEVTWWLNTSLSTNRKGTSTWQIWKILQNLCLTLTTLFSSLNTHDPPHPPHLCPPHLFFGFASHLNTCPLINQNLFCNLYSASVSALWTQPLNTVSFRRFKSHSHIHPVS